MKHYLLCIALMFIKTIDAQTVVLDKQTKKPVAYATISFGNGNGIFADDDGKFTFTKKLYKDIDSLFISAIGYKALAVQTQTLNDTLYMQSQINELDEVFLFPKGKGKAETIKPTVHDDYYKCWLPTIESEIAVYFKKESTKPQQISSVLLPIKVEAKDWNKRKRKTSEKRPFSTLLKLMFYENDNGFPGLPLTYDNITFRITHKSEAVADIDVSNYNIFIPKKGVFVALQVLGYTDATGKLLPNKKYREISTKRGIVKIPTTFRPLLPFTDKITDSKTFVKRVFLNDGKWIVFNKTNVKDSNLLKAGLKNYAMGLSLLTYKDD